MGLLRTPPELTEPLNTPLSQTQIADSPNRYGTVIFSPTNPAHTYPFRTVADGVQVIEKLSD